MTKNDPPGSVFPTYIIYIYIIGWKNGTRRVIFLQYSTFLPSSPWQLHLYLWKGVGDMSLLWGQYTCNVGRVHLYCWNSIPVLLGQYICTVGTLHHYITLSSLISIVAPVEPCKNIVQRGEPLVKI